MDLEKLKENLAWNIAKGLREDFEQIFLSGNLRDTIKVEKTLDGWRIEVPAKRYDLKRFNKEGIIVYTNNGSYASVVDEYGGFSKKHKDYVDLAIDSAIDDVFYGRVSVQKE